VEGKERRHFKRWKVVVRCTVGWQNKRIRGLTRNLSYGGAFISTQANIVPPEGAFVTVRLDFAKNEAATEDVLSVKFEEPILKIRDQLGSVFHALTLDQLDN